MKKEKELKFKPEELQRRVQAYLKRIKEDSKSELNYPLYQYGLWNIYHSASCLDNGGHTADGLYEGRFIDAVVKLAKLRDCGNYELSHPFGGYVSLAQIKKLPEAKISIDDLVKEN